jgi:hypothetical protein
MLGGVVKNSTDPQASLQTASLVIMSNVMHNRSLSKTAHRRLTPQGSRRDPRFQKNGRGGGI